VGRLQARFFQTCSDLSSAGKKVSIRSSCNVTSVGVPSVMIVLNRRMSRPSFRRCTGSNHLVGGKRRVAIDAVLSSRSSPSSRSARDSR
jgi:hypothetical protein